VSYAGSSPRVGVQGQGERSFAPAHHSASASVTGREDDGGQNQYDETREMHQGFARQARENGGWSVNASVSGIC